MVTKYRKIIKKRLGKLTLGVFLIFSHFVSKAAMTEKYWKKIEKRLKKFTLKAFLIFVILFQNPQ